MPCIRDSSLEMIVHSNRQEKFYSSKPKSESRIDLIKAVDEPFEYEL